MEHSPTLKLIHTSEVRPAPSAQPDSSATEPNESRKPNETESHSEQSQESMSSAEFSAETGQEEDGEPRAKEGEAFADDASAIGHAIMRDYKSWIVECRKEIAEYELAVAVHRHEIAEYKDQIQDYKDQIADLESRNESYESQFAGNKNEIARLHKRISDENNRNLRATRLDDWPFEIEIDGVTRRTSVVEREMYSDGFVDGFADGRTFGRRGLEFVWWPLMGVVVLTGLWFSYERGVKTAVQEIAKTHGDCGLGGIPGAVGAYVRQVEPDERRIVPERTSGARQRYTGSWRSVIWKKEPLDDEPEPLSDGR
jgi:hypothetical protein